MSAVRIEMPLDRDPGVLQHDVVHQGLVDAVDVPRVAGFGSYVIAIPGDEAEHDGLREGLHLNGLPGLTPSRN